MHIAYLSIGKVCVLHLLLSVLGENIRTARKYRGFTLKELAEKIGVTQPTLSRIENSETGAKNTLIALAKELQDNFGEPWLDEFIDTSAQKGLSRREILEDTSVAELVSLKFGGATNETARTLAKLLDEEIRKSARIKSYPLRKGAKGYDDD